jgi:hypothetical protein
MRKARACLCAAVIALIASPALSARAGGSTADREAARFLSGKAYDEFEAKHYQRAIELFQQAEARFHAPPHLLYTARAQVKLGLYLEARATYERIIAERLAADAPAPFRDAQVSARFELGEVLATMPSLVVTLPAPPAGARVLVDGDPLASADLGRPRRMNPGTHTVIAEAPGMLRVVRSVVLATGRGQERVDLTLSPPKHPSRLVVPAVIAFSVGAAMLAVGISGAVLLHNAQPSQPPGLRAMEIAGFTAGGLAVGTGIVLLALPPRTPSSVSIPVVRLRVGVGPSSMSFGGAF